MTASSAMRLMWLFLNKPGILPSKEENQGGNSGAQSPQGQVNFCLLTVGRSIVIEGTLEACSRMLILSIPAPIPINWNQSGSTLFLHGFWPALATLNIFGP